MKISTRGRYALRVMIDLAERQNEKYVPLKSISIRQNIPFKYIENIMRDLSKNGLVYGVHGKGGGYHLTRNSRDYTIDEILEVTEGGLAPVSCLECKENTCPLKDRCKTLLMWKDFYRLIKDYFSSITLSSLVGNTSVFEEGLGL